MLKDTMSFSKAKPKILILNSDSPNNRGDRAILQGNIKLLRKQWPHAEIWALSEYSERDTEWFSINFLHMSAYTMNPVNLLKLMIFAKNCDYVFWGGGEILKDYTNKLGNLYWALRVWSIWVVNKKLYGMFQGIGPTNSNLSKRLIAFAVNKTQVFFVRDKMSKDKLHSWGVKTKVIDSYDPAVIIEANKPNDATLDTLKKEFDIDSSFLENSIGVGLRKWFHYEKNGWFPQKLKLFKSKKIPENEEFINYVNHTAALLDWVVETFNNNIVFYPMHMSESEDDASFSRLIAEKMKHTDRTRSIDRDILSPQDYIDTISRSKMFLGVRLHSTILATGAKVPSFVFYYVDKGKLFFEQIGMKEYSSPVEDLANKNKLNSIKQCISALHKNSQDVSASLNSVFISMQKHIYDRFNQGIEE